MVERQKESLERLVDPEATGTLPAMVEAVLAGAGISLGPWGCGLGWDLVDLDPAWTMTLSCQLGYRGLDLGRLDLRLPWLLDDQARATAPSDACVGRHEGLWLGGPRVPLLQLRDAPGAWVRWRSGQGLLDPEDVQRGLRPTAVVTPDAGRGLFFNETKAGGATIRPVWMSTVEALRDAETGKPWVVTPVGLFSAATAHHVATALPEAFDPGLDPRDREALTAAVRNMMARDRADREARGCTAFADNTKFAPGTSTLRTYGDLLGEAVVEALQRLLRQAQWLQRSGRRKDKDPAWLGPWLGRRVSGRIAALVASRDAAITAPPRSDNTLALAEAERKVTVFGPHGLRPPVRGSLDFRDLHPGWRGTLCPVHTPESEQTSLVRHLALGDIADAAGLGAWRDVSWSAALVPFLNHDEQARAILAAKNLEQALPLVAPDIPLVRTGVEQLLAERHGVARAATAGTVTRVAPDAVTVRNHRRPQGERHPIGPAGKGPIGDDWLHCVAPDERVAHRAVLAHAPDVRLDDDGVPHLALGVDLMVAVTPWHGRNYEDALVVRAGAATRLRHRERTIASDDLWPGEWVDQQVWTDRDVAGHLPTVTAGDVLAAVRDSSGACLRRFLAPVSGTLLSLDADTADRRITAVVEHECELEVGDKLTNRHGGKGIVAVIVPDAEMPRLPDGTPVDVITSPAGIVRRLNIGQVHEMAVGLLAHLDGADHVVAGRRLVDRPALAAALADRGAPGGRLPLSDAAGRPLFDAAPVLVGPQHYLKLHHLAEKKLSVRADGAVSPTTGQPTRGTTYRDGERIGSGQRLGEMELWALQAMGARHLVADAIRDRGGVPDAGGVRPVLRSVVAHLAATGLLVAPGDADGPFEPDPGLPDDDLLRQADAFHVVPSRWRFLEPMTPADFDVREVAPTPGRPYELDPRTQPFHAGAFAAPDAATRVTRCFLLPVAYAAGGHLDQTPVTVRAPGAATPTVLRGKRLAALHRLAGVVASAHAWASYVEGGPERGDVRAREDLWVDVAAGWLPALLAGDEATPHADAVARRLTEQSVPDPAWAAVAADLLPLLERWSNRLPILPAAFRPVGRDRLDVLYLRLAESLGLTRAPLKTRAFRAAKPRVVEVDPEGVLGLVHSIIGTDDATEAASPRARGGGREPRSLLARLTGKTGLLRGALLGTTTFRSGRGVIVPDPDRPIGTVGLPQRLLDAVVGEPDPHDPTACTVYIVRQPTLRPANIVALTAELVPGHAIHLHPDLCEALAGDFDGDTVAVHRPVTAAARAEALRRFGVAAALRNPASGDFLAKSDLDLALGHQLLAGDPRAGDLPAFAAELAGLAPDAAIERLAALQRERWEAATGWSLGFVDLPNLGHLADLDDAALADALGSVLADSPLGTLHRAGAAGKTAALRQLLVARGVQHGFNAILPDPDIPDCFIDGLSDKHWFLGARAGAARLAEKKLLTPYAGGFTKLLAEIAYEVEVGADDCGSTAAPRRPLTCRDAMPCAGCLGTLPHGVPAEPGQRVGLLAAMLVGERSTQLAMKTFHAGGADAVDLTTLRALFGQGRAPLFESLLEARGVSGEPTLAGLLDAAASGTSPDAADLGAALEPVADAVAGAFKGAVARVWAEVLLKQLLEVWRAGPGSGSLATRAKLFGRDPLVVATLHGAAPTGEVPDPLTQRHRVDLLVGRWQV